MTEIIINANDRRVQYTATNGQTVFPYDFPIYAGTEISVVRNRAGVLSTLALTTNYTLSGIGAQAGGNVTLTAGAVAGDVMTLSGATPYERTSDYGEGGDFKASTLNKDLDRLTIMAQQLDTRIGRALTLNIADPATGMELAIEAAADRQGRALIFNATGDGLMAGPNATEIAVAEGFANAAATSATNAATSATSASNSATSASASATAAATSATSAGTSATNAATSETNAAASATSASNSATSATGSASAAATSATSAATSATNAGNSATAAATSATNASNSATAAATSATNASNSADDAEYWAGQAAASNYDPTNVAITGGSISGVALEGRFSGRVNFKRQVGNVVISSGKLTIPNGYGSVNADTEGGATTDELETVVYTGDVNPEWGDTILIYPSASARDITVKHGVGNIRCQYGKDFTLFDTNDFVRLTSHASGFWLAEKIVGAVPDSVRENFSAVTGGQVTGQRIYTISFTIADDAVATFSPISVTGNQNGLSVISAQSSFIARNALAWFKSGASAAMVSINSGASVTVNATAGTLTGTTGTDGNINVRCNTDGLFYVENRLGATTTITVTLLG